MNVLNKLVKVPVNFEKEVSNAELNASLLLFKLKIFQDLVIWKIHKYVDKCSFLFI